MVFAFPRAFAPRSRVFCAAKSCKASAPLSSRQALGTPLTHCLLVADVPFLAEKSSSSLEFKLQFHCYTLLIEVANESQLRGTVATSNGVMINTPNLSKMTTTYAFFSCQRQPLHACSLGVMRPFTDHS